MFNLSVGLEKPIATLFFYSLSVLYSMENTIEKFDWQLPELTRGSIYSSHDEKKYRNPTLAKLQEEYEHTAKVYTSLRNEWNMLIRNFYKKSMGVSLKEGTGRHQIPIRIEAAPQEGFIDIIEKNYPYLDFQELYILSQYVKAAQQAEPYFTDMHASHHLRMSLEYAQYRLKEFDILKLTKSIFPFLEPQNKDIFGTYFTKSSHIELYVFPIKIFSILHGINDHSLFIIILAHELAHGYNHLGFDKDNRIWESFPATDDYIAEGLAQYYTREFIMSYLHKDAKLQEVFNFLLLFQPEPYNIFSRWELTLEQMYGAFIDARRNNVIHYSDFEKIMDNALKRIR